MSDEFDDIEEIEEDEEYVDVEEQATGMRLNRFLSLCGVGSRRSSETLIRDGRVTLNGTVVTELATRIVDGDQVAVDGTTVKAPRRYTLVMMNKPPGVVCTRKDPQQRTTIYDLMPSGFSSLKYVGRLDLQSRGLVLFTDDGELANRLAHPSRQMPRTYIVWPRRPFNAADAAALRKGVDIGEGEIGRASKFKLIGEHAEMTLNEGKNREIRRMLLAVNHRVRDLKRISFGPLQLGDLPTGEFRELTEEEAGELYATAELGE